MNHLRRRAFLAALGASVAATVEPGWAKKGKSPGPSAIERPPLRFFGVYMPHGHAYEYFNPRPGFDFNYEHAIFAPFEDELTYGKKYKSALILVDGVDLSAGLLTGTVGHEAPRVILTGSGADGKNASLDQFLAVDRGLGAETIHTSLTLGVGNAQSGPENNISYAKGGAELPKIVDPRLLFDELFGTPVSGKSKAQLASERALGLSILDFAAADLKALRKSAPSAARLMLEQHQSSLRDIEKRLTKTAPACAAPRRPRVFDKTRAYGGGEPNFDEITNLMIDLSVRAASCDLTRFTTLFLNDLSRTQMAPGLPADIHQGVAHKYEARTDKVPGQPKTWQALAAQNRYTMNKLARLAWRLDQAGLLDDSIVYASGDLGDPARHSSRHVPSVLIGGAGGKWSGGKRVAIHPGSVPNNRILVSIAQRFGVETDRFGHSSSSEVLTGNLNEELERPSAVLEGPVGVDD